MTASYRSASWVHWVLVVSLALIIGVSTAPATARTPLRPTTAPAAKPPATAPAAAAPTFAGEWKTSYGIMRLVQKGDALEGTYGSGLAEATIQGKLTAGGKKFTFTYTEPNANGEGSFDLAPDGASFAGKWRVAGAADWFAWTGTRTAPAGAALAAVAPANSFDGLWNTTYGRMRLRQTGNTVRGVYSFAGGSNVEGEVDGQTLKFKYDQPDGEKGETVVRLADGAQAFEGTWKATNGSGGTWSGTRIKPQAGVVWLVVLEAHWEHDLGEKEYSFGEMLRAYFARVPNVQVRHRFFQDEPDLRRWCAEVPYLAEPVVLHISSHGSQKGVQAGGKEIPADVVIDCMRNSGAAGNLRLLHFGSCLVAGGDIPARIHEAVGPAGARFPISGYTREADWAGSAVVDFTYLDLVLARGMSPADAVEQTKKMISFANDKPRAGEAIAPTGLVVIEPKATTAKASEVKAPK